MTAADRHLEAEPVEKLRAEFSFFGVHRPDQDEARRVGEGYALPLDDIDAGHGGVEEDVHHMVVEEVHLVDVEDPPVCRCQNPWFEGAYPFLIAGFTSTARTTRPVLEPNGRLTVSCA